MMLFSVIFRLFSVVWYQDGCVTLTLLTLYRRCSLWCFLAFTMSVRSQCHCTDTVIDETKDQPLQPNASLDKRRINHDRRKPCTTVEWERTMSKSDVKFVLIKVQFKEVNDDSDLWRIKNSLISEGICQNPWGSDILHLLSSLVRPWLASQRRKEITSVQWTSNNASASITIVGCSAVIRHLWSKMNYVASFWHQQNQEKRVKWIYYTCKLTTDAKRTEIVTAEQDFMPASWTEYKIGPETVQKFTKRKWII